MKKAMFGRGRGWFGGWGPGWWGGGGWGRGNPYPFCRFFPWLPRGWRWMAGGAFYGPWAAAPLALYGGWGWPALAARWPLLPFGRLLW